MKKWIIPLAILCVCLFVPFIKADIIDYYALGNASSATPLKTPHPSAAASHSAQGQSFNTTITMDLTSVWFSLLKTGNPVGNAHAILYGHNGVFGASSVPNATALATSDNFDVTTLNGTATLREFTFSGGNIRELQAGTLYTIAFVNPGAGIDAANFPQIERDATAPTHNGNDFYYQNGGWVAAVTADLIFYLFDPTAVPPQNLVNASDPTFSRDTAGEVNITVRDWDHRSELNYHEIQVNTTGDVETFTIRWTEATNTFTEQTDTDNICLLNTSTRTFLDKWTVDLMYNFTMTGGQEGFCDVRVYALGDGALNDTDMYLNQFIFVYYVWDAIGDLINSAFSQFGIIDYMSQSIAYVNGISAQFASSIANMITLITQQFRIITNIFTWIIRWFTRFTDMILTLAGHITSLFDGTGALVTYLGNWWTFIDLASWFPLVTLVGVLMWVDSIVKRGKTQGEVQVAIRDLQTVMSILSYFTAMFTLVINTVVDTTFRMFDAIT